MSKKPGDREAELVPVKLPRWMKKLAAQVGEETDETLGEVFERLAGAALKRDHGAKLKRVDGGKATAKAGA